MIGGGIGWKVGANNGGQLSTGEKRGDTALTTRCHVGLRGHFPKKCLLGLGKREREREGSRGRREKRREEKRKGEKRNEACSPRSKRASACKTGVGRVRSERQNSGSARDTLSQHGSTRNSSSFLFKPAPLITTTTTTTTINHQPAETLLSTPRRNNRYESFFGKEALGVSPGDPIPPSDTILSDEN